MHHFGFRYVPSDANVSQTKNKMWEKLGGDVICNKRDRGKSAFTFDA